MKFDYKPKLFKFSISVCNASDKSSSCDGIRSSTFDFFTLSFNNWFRILILCLVSADLSAVDFLIDFLSEKSSKSKKFNLFFFHKHK